VDELGYRGAEVVGFEAEGAGRTFEDNAVVGVDQVEAVGPSGVGALGGVTEFVEDGGELDAEFADAGSGDVGAFVFVFWGWRRRHCL